ncbi:MAG: M1 family metallopeptidase [Kofleriaceae bacterium]
MKRALLIVAIAACGGGGSNTPTTSTVTQGAPAPPADPAFDPPQPTLRLSRHFLPTHVTARVAADPAKPDFTGEITIDGELDRRAFGTWLNAKDLKIGTATATSGPKTVTLRVKQVGELVQLRADQPLDQGHWAITVAYTGKVMFGGHGLFASKWGTDVYLSTQFEAVSSREVFPMIDEPDLKIPWQVTIDAPKGQTVLSNTAETGRKAIDATHERIAFAETKPLPTYLIAFAIGPFEVVDAGKATKSGVAIRVATPKGTVKKAEYIRSSMVKIVDALENWFQIPYPYPKLDLVIVPEQQGAMENAGMITCVSQSLLYDQPFANDKYRMISLIGHETAHQWFGDLVTAAWWEDIWLNESFATWMEDKVLAAFDPSWPPEASENRAQAMRADDVASARKIRQPIKTEADMHNAFDDITYPKGSTILRMVEHQIGETAFQTAIQRYLKAHADGNAKAEDLFASFDEIAGKPLGKLVTSWIEQAGVPEVAMDLTCDGGGKSKLVLSQSRYLPNAKADETLWTIPVCVAFEGPKGERLDQCTVMTGQTAELDLPSCPNWFTAAGNYGYFHNRVDEKVLVALRDKGWSKLSPDERISIFGDIETYAMQSKLSLDMWWSWGGKMIGDKNDRELADSFGVPGDLKQAMTPAEKETVRARFRKLIEPMAKRYSLLVSPDESVEKSAAHVSFLGAIEGAHSHVYDAEAKKLFAKLDTLPVSQRGWVASIAIAADPKLALTLKDRFDKETDKHTRTQLMFLMTGVRDKTVHHQVLDGIFNDQGLSPLEVAYSMWGGSDDPEVLADTTAYIKEHFDAIAPKLPIEGDFPLRVALVVPFLRMCDPERRDADIAWVTEKFANVPTAQLPIKQGIERNDTCIARRKQLEPAIKAWLGTK